MIIDTIDFRNDVAAQKYWQPPASWTPERRQIEVKERIFSGMWLGARKMDGSFYKFIKDEDGNMELIGRSKGVGGDYLNKIDWVPQLMPFFQNLPNGTCLLGEIVFPENEGSKNVTTIMGCLVDKAIARQEKGAKLHYYVFDILAYNNVSFLDYVFAARVDALKKLDTYGCKYVSVAEYCDKEGLWELLGTTLENGGEGIVMTRKMSYYQPDKRPSKDTMKVKKEISNTIDCFFTGRGTEPTKIYSGKEIEGWEYWVNSITDEKLPVGARYRDFMSGAAIVPVTKPYYYGWCGSLEIGLIRDGVVVPIGLLSGLTDEIKANPLKYKGRVIEVSAMEIDSESHSLRHGKMLQFRDDKPMLECTYDQLLQ